MPGVSKPQFPYLSKGLSGLLCQPKALGQAPKPEPPSSWPSLLQPGPGHVSQHPVSPPCQATGKARLALKGGWSLPATRQRCTVAECQEPSPSPALLDKHLEASRPGSSPGSQVVEVFLQPRFPHLHFGASTPWWGIRELCGVTVDVHQSASFCHLVMCDSFIPTGDT